MFLIAVSMQLNVGNVEMWKCVILKVLLIILVLRKPE